MRISNGFALLFAVLAMACGPGTHGTGDDDDTGDGGPTIDSGGTPQADAAPIADAGPLPFNGVIYAHSYDQLFQVNPDTLDVTLIGPFLWPAEVGGFDQMTDIAVDKDGNIVGVSFDKVYSVNAATVACTYLAPLSTQFNGLSFVPANLIDMTGEEVLVGSTLNGTFWRLDPMTGASTQIGVYGGIYTSSGDIVSVDGFGTVATAKGTGVNDVLVRLDVTTGMATPIGSNTGYIDIWGVGYWKNKVFGFLSTNEFVLIDVDTGVATYVSTGPVNWWGAGVTTSAPIIP